MPLGIGWLIRSFTILPALAFLAVLWLTLLPAAHFAASVVIFFSGRYPVGMFRIISGVMRCSANCGAYFFHLYDEYPPIDLESRPETKLQFSVEYPSRPNRLLNAPLIGLPLKSLLCFPHLLALTALYFLAGAIVFLASFAVFFDHQFPAGLHELVTGILRWGMRVNSYVLGLTDRYPPFSLS